MTAAEAPHHLVVRQVSKRFGATTVLDRVDLTIQRGELITLLGPSGCGKTTLLRLVAGLDSPNTGSVELAGRDITRVPPHRAQCRRRLPVLCSVSALDRRRQRRLRPEGARALARRRSTPR